MNSEAVHPADTTLTQFIAGALPEREIESTAWHVSDCAECYMVLTESVRIEREKTEAEPGRRQKWSLPLAAALAAVAITTIITVAAAYRLLRDPVRLLIEASPPQYRTVAGRLYGFEEWAKFRVFRGPNSVDAADLELQGAAGQVLEKTANRDTPESRHAAGLANLFLGRYDESLAALEQAAKGSNDPRMWSDLAAARLSVAKGDTAQLNRALSEADHALRLDPTSAEALFNRASILQALGRSGEARDAWQRYLAVDPNSGWGREARAHLSGP